MRDEGLNEKGKQKLARCGSSMKVWVGVQGSKYPMSSFHCYIPGPEAISLRNWAPSF